jgi:cytochrome c oxidase subunit I
VGYFVWGHHMFTSGMSYYARWFFSFLTFIVAIPSAIKVFNWISTMYGGSIDLKPPLLYAISFIFPLPHRWFHRPGSRCTGNQRSDT